jgi:hypothetical protein
MEIELTIKIGDATIVKVRSDSQRDVIEQAAFFSDLPSACPVCREPVKFTSRRPSGYEYYGLRCTGRPSHETTFGVHREGGTLFYKASEPWTAWQPGARPEGEADVAPEPAPRAMPREAGRQSARPQTGRPNGSSREQVPF